MSSKLLLSEKEAYFKFLDIFDNQDKHFCIVNIVVKEEQYINGNIYYDITYTYKYSSNSPEAQRAHPFKYNPKIRESDDINGVIVIKNKLTETMIDYLLMDKDELSKQIGNTWWIQYKIKIMEALNLFWD